MNEDPQYMHDLHHMSNGDKLAEERVYGYQFWRTIHIEFPEYQEWIYE